jgi:hypothetical protein
MGKMILTVLGMVAEMELGFIKDTLGLCQGGRFATPGKRVDRKNGLALCDR